MHYRSEREEEEGVYGDGSGVPTFLNGLYLLFLKSREVTGGGVRLRQYSGGPVWLSAASH